MLGLMVMLVLGIFSLMMAVALPTVFINISHSIRVTSIISLCIAALSFNASYIQAIGSNAGIYSGLYQVLALLIGLSIMLCLLVKLNDFNYITGTLIFVLVLMVNLLTSTFEVDISMLNVTVIVAWLYSTVLSINYLCTTDFSPQLVKADPTGKRARMIKEAKDRSFFSSLLYPTIYSLLAISPASSALSSISSVSASNIELENLRLQLKLRMEGFQLPVDFDSDTFKKVLNGFFQAEGHVSCKVRPTVFVPVLTFNQLYNDQSVEFFLTAWHVLGRKGSLYITQTIKGNLVINYFTGSWKHVLELNNFFNLCYGEKYVAFAKLAMIHNLMKDKSPESIILAVRLSYSLAVTGAERPTELSEVLSSMGLVSETAINAPLPTFSDNQAALSPPFLIGFILGDGTLYVRLKVRGSSIRVVPGVFLPQVDTEYNKAFLTFVQSYLLSCGIKSNITSFEKMIRLEVTAFSNVFGLFVPLVAPYAKYFYWKSHQYVILSTVSKLVLANEHSVPYGMKVIIDTLYRFENVRKYPIEHWYNKLDSSAMTPSPQVKARIDALIK